ncbi:unnamed protein product [Brassicogethes aeneus]|uniref:Leucine-rich PPR motif-containing protein, mitochondrial n=1 Tax=Brassicogethes aeneus TaxID=1431903 RepID=A0A9P0B1K8_BRAAE|nr:unnamed protein product [Brassicogethes aeneus]
MYRRYLHVFKHLNKYKNCAVNKINYAQYYGAKDIFSFNNIYQGVRCLNTQHLNDDLETSSDQTKIKTNVKNIKDLLNTNLVSGNVSSLRLIKNLLPSTNFDKYSPDEIILLFECAGKLAYNYSKEERDDLCQKLVKYLPKFNKLDINIYHKYLEICTENRSLVNPKQFLNNLRCEPNSETYKLLLRNVCEFGDLETSIIILETMKEKQIPIDEEVFANLVLVYILKGGLNGGESVLKTMKSAQVPETKLTKLAIFKGLASRLDFNEFKNALHKYPVELDDVDTLELLEYLGSNGNYKWISEFPKQQFSRDFQIKINNLCVHLIHMDKVDAAIEIYKHYIDVSQENDYGFQLLKEMLLLNKDIEKIINVAKEFKEKELNSNCLEKLTNVALKFGHIEPAWTLLTNFDELRPHYFWPILIIASKREGEQGVQSVLKKIYEYNVHLDSESLEWYVFRFCDLSQPKLIIKKMQTFDYTVKELLSPLVTVLLRNNKLIQAENLVKSYNVGIFGDEILPQLAHCFLKTKNTKAVVTILSTFCESNVNSSDHVGEFLIRVVGLYKNTPQINQFTELLKVLKENMLKIHYNSFEIIQNKMEGKNLGDLQDLLRAVSEFQIPPEPSQIPHPREMNIQELECHLEELLEKKMETRGVLRRLIQLHCNSGNHKRVKELQDMFITKGYTESAGMITSVFYSYVQGGHLPQALEVYYELKKNQPNFIIDEYKIIDLVALMVKEKVVDQAINIINEESKARKVFGGKGIVRNCLNLLNNFEDVNKQNEIFKLLLKYEYCQPTNVILGPIIRLNMKCDVQKAVERFVEFSNQYKCTPLQLELIRALLEENNEDLIKAALTATEKVHGTTAAFSVYASALAEKGLTKKLTKYLGMITIPLVREINKRCERWVHESKVEPLKTLAIASERISSEVVDRSKVVNSIMDIYCSRKDCESAIDLCNSFNEDDFIRKGLLQRLENLLIKCNYKKATLVNK